MNKLTLHFVLATTFLSALCAHAAPLKPLPTQHTVLQQPIDGARFTFAVAGDNRSTGHGEPMPPSLQQICSELGLIKPAFTLWTGDVIEGYGDSVGEANAEYDVFFKSVSLTGSPVFNAPGNHEFTLDPALLPVYRKRMGDLYGSFDYGNSHFVQLNSCAVEADGSIRSGDLDTAQWDWLEQDLAAHASAANTFVFLHHFPFGPVDDDPKLDSGLASGEVRDRLHKLFVKYHVRTVYAGHNHRYYRTVKDGVEYVISGGAGAPLDASPVEGGFLHYLLVHVDGTKVKADILQPWHLVATPTKAAAPNVAEVHVSNTQGTDVDLAGLTVRVPKPGAGETYTVTASLAYKKKSKPGVAKVIEVAPVPGTSLVDVTIAAHSVASRSLTVDLALTSK